MVYLYNPAAKVPVLTSNCWSSLSMSNISITHLFVLLSEVGWALTICYISWANTILYHTHPAEACFDGCRGS